MARTIRRALVALAIGLCPLAQAEANDLSDFLRDSERFELWTDCRPVPFQAHALGDATKIGVTKTRIETAVRSRLRGARIYTDSSRGSPFFLSIIVFVRGAAYSIELELNKTLLDPISSTAFPTPTWGREHWDTHGGNRGYIMALVGEFMDEFIDAYLRVNEDACGR